MVPHLNDANEPNEWDIFRSHPHKVLRVHTNGVLAGVERHTSAPLARVSALFHDVGKLNPNFQPKLDNHQGSEYSNHAYLSAVAFLSFVERNRNWEELGFKSSAQIYAAAALIASHHKHLPHLRVIFSKFECERLTEFLHSKPYLPCSEFLSQWLSHERYEIKAEQAASLLASFNILTDKKRTGIDSTLDFWLDTQFSFSALIESDKRDASDNKRYRRDEQLEWAQGNFAPALKATFDGLVVKSDLDIVRTSIRNEAIESLQTLLETGQRIFTLTAPTGAGKTFTLLAIASEIRRDREYLSTIYGLPFLSITEQVEGICRNIWKDNEDWVSRLDSRAQNPRLDALIEENDKNPEAVGQLMQEHFSAQTFDAAFVITTFVQIFETLLSNSNTTLLKLPNFSKTIFLLDEIQALPPRLYIFLTAYLQTWCDKHDCYAILSTATMPHLELLDQPGTPQKQRPRNLFPNYRPPAELLDFRKFFAESVFDRYCIEPHGEWNLSDLAGSVENETESVLAILNTIADTKALYEELTQNRCLDDTEIVLLNTHYILDDRRQKIADCKAFLKSKQRVILISTQLIEAGVDVDFPVVYRDLCPLPNLIQSAGRCNRNGILPRGTVVFFKLVDNDGKCRAHTIYKHPSDKILLEKTCAALSQSHNERELLEVQRLFFKDMAHTFAIGDHPLWTKEEGKRKRIENANLIEYIADFNYPVVGSFRLIDEEEFGEEFQIYIPNSLEDEKWEQLRALTQTLAEFHTEKRSQENIRSLQIQLDIQLRKMSGRIVQIRLPRGTTMPPVETKNTGEVRELCGLRRLLHFADDYSFKLGLRIEGGGTIIL